MSIASKNSNASVIADAFEHEFGIEADGTASSPYRICPVGAHIDHQHGKVTGFAIDKMMRIAYSKNENGAIKAKSRQFSSCVEWNIQDIPKAKQNDWADYIRGASMVLSKRFLLGYGINAYIDGELPTGGLSSSAAVIIAFLIALCNVNKIEITARELLETALEAENLYVGVNCGKLDQACEIYAKNDSLLYMDMADNSDDSVKFIKCPENMKPFQIAVFFSGVERSLASTKYNLRVDECKVAAFMLKAYAGIDYDSISKTFLRDVPREVYDMYKRRLPLPLYKRAEHFYTELARTEAAAEAFRQGDINAFGKLSTASGESSITNYEAGSPELITLHNIAKSLDGVYGGRFSGAGFKGCTFALVEPSYADAVCKAVKEKYQNAFPAAAKNFKAFLCNPADGVCGGR